jgi:hypothetical protein
VFRKKLEGVFLVEFKFFSHNKYFTTDTVYTYTTTCDLDALLIAYDMN